MDTLTTTACRRPRLSRQGHATLETNVIPLNRPDLQAACSRCNQSELCLPAGLGPDGMSWLESVIGDRLRVKRGQHLYRSGDSFGAIYVVTSGFFKSAIFTEDGQDQVIGFQMAGEILGMDGIHTEFHSCNAVALEDSEVCPIDFAGLECLSSQIPALQRRLNRIMSSEIVRDQGVLMLLGTMRAEERLASFLLNLSQRLTARGYSPRDFHLRMSRSEIGSYLGLKQETVSRGFTRLQEEGVISKQNRHICILDMPMLKKLTAQIPAHSQRFVPAASLDGQPPSVAEEAHWFRNPGASIPEQHSVA